MSVGGNVRVDHNGKKRGNDEKGGGDGRSIGFIVGSEMNCRVEDRSLTDKFCSVEDHPEEFMNNSSKWAKNGNEDQREIGYSMNKDWK